MDGVPAIYKGRIVPKDNFRAFIYSAEGAKKLVNSWDAYEKHMETGLWFARQKDASPNNDVKSVKHKKGKRPAK